MTHLTLDQLAANAGMDLGYSVWHQVDQNTIDNFARLTVDTQWIHTDPGRAASGPFGAPITHGFLTLSLCSLFLAECLTVSDATMTVNYGLDRVRFPSPAKVGSRLRGHAVLRLSHHVAGGVQSAVQITVEAEEASKPACVAEMVIRFMR